MSNEVTVVRVTRKIKLEGTDYVAVPIMNATSDYDAMQKAKALVEAQEDAGWALRWTREVKDVALQSWERTLSAEVLTPSEIIRDEIVKEMAETFVEPKSTDNPDGPIGSSDDEVIF